MVTDSGRTFLSTQHPTGMATGSARIGSAIELQDGRSQVEDFEAVYAELEPEQSWERKPFWARVLSIATIALISACGWAAIIAVVRFLW